MNANKRGSMNTMNGGGSNGSSSGGGLNVSLRGLFQPQMQTQPRNGSVNGNNRRRSVAAGGSGDSFDRSLSLEDALCGEMQQQDFRSSFHRTSKSPNKASTRRMSMPVTTHGSIYYEDIKDSGSGSGSSQSYSSSNSHNNSSGLSGVAQILLPQLRRSSMQSGGGGSVAKPKRRSSMFSSLGGGSAEMGIPEEDAELFDHEDDPYGEEAYRNNERSEEEDGIVCVEEERLRGIYDKINSLRAQQDAELRKKDLAVDALLHENATLHKRLEVLLADADDRHTVSEYAKLITSTMPPPHVADSNYALNLQTQLCRALKKMGTLEDKLIRTVSGNVMESDQVTELQSKLAEMDDESFRTDLDRSKDLLSMEMEMERERYENEARLAEKERELEEMRERLELEREAHLRTREALSGADSDNNAKARGGGTPPLLPPSSSAVNRPFMENHAA